ncbi:hypothetical protein KGF54_002006 [Candida jiufengensis]|uniref:uncharacterized protein n=1 Tax=Candida jiufengensis TaxID=497108 RepID=UPI0022240118|nr:uncharacterized protein KGF54_002006 [Candida jiufengensis]KAI5954231.1 hypothetical protein KGF54_002006 [Candida jiufengensis]
MAIKKSYNPKSFTKLLNSKLNTNTTKGGINIDDLKFNIKNDDSDMLIYLIYLSYINDLINDSKRIGLSSSGSSSNNKDSGSGISGTTETITERDNSKDLDYQDDKDEESFDDESDDINETTLDLADESLHEKYRGL